MPRRLILSLLCAAAVALAAAAAAAEAPDAIGAPGDAAPVLKSSPPVPLDGGEVRVSAERIERNNDERIVTGEGAVTIRHRDMRLVADRAVYHEQTKEVIADGNVVLDSGADRLQGEHLELNLDTRVGFLEHAQGFVQTYYFTGERIEKRGPDHYFLRGGSFTTCEGVLPDWSIHATSTDVTVDEYLRAWNPTLRVKRLPVFYFPYAIFPIKRDRATGLLIPTLALTPIDGFTVRNSFFWAPRDDFDATIGLDYLEKTGWGANGEMRYLRAPRTQGVVNAQFLQNTRTESQHWSVATRNSQQLPFGIQGEAEAFIQSDRQFIATQGTTIEERSDERTTSSFYLNRSWSAWDFALSGRNEQSLITEQRTTLTRFPELTVNRTSNRLFGTDLFLKLSASGVQLARDDAFTSLSTTRLHLSPEMTWPLSLGSVARVIPTVGYALTQYSNDIEGNEATRSLPMYRIGLEGPRPYRIWDLPGDGRFEKLKHLIEPRLTYVHTPSIDQDLLPQFDSVDRIPHANRLEYSLSNTLFAKLRPTGPAAPADAAAPPRSVTQELLWFKLSQNYTFGGDPAAGIDHPFSALEWEARTRPLTGLEVWWRGNYDVYGDGVGYQNVSLTWRASDITSFRGDWRTARDSTQDFLDIGVTLALGHIGIDGRSRYNLAEETFVENRVSVKYTSQCWDVTLGYVRWTDTYEYSLLFSLKGIGTVVKI